MSKNLTRKGLALGATLALGTTLIAGAPAVAANEVTLAPSVGTSYGMILGETFTFKATLGETISTGVYSKLKFKVDNATGASLTPSFTQAGATTQSPAGAFTDTTKVVKMTGGTVTGSTATLAITSAASASHTVDVTAWIDTNDNDLVDDAFASAKQTVSFKKASEVKTNVVLGALTENDTTVSASFTFTDLNNDQLALVEDQFGINVVKGDGTQLTGASSEDAIVIDNANADGEVELEWNTTTKVFEGTTEAVGALAKGAVVKSQILFIDGNSANTSIDASAAVTLGDAVYGTVVARKVALFTATTVRSTTAAQADSSPATEDGYLTTTDDVLRNSTFELQVKATDADGVAVAGVAVGVKITTTASLASTSGAVVSLAVGGTTYTDTTKLPGYSTTVAKLSAVTDAKGIAKISVTTAGFTAGDDVIAWFTAENFKAKVVANNAAETYNAYIADDRNVVGYSTADYELSITEGSNIVVPVVLVNQFGGTPADEWDARIYASSVDSGRTTDVVANSGTVAAVVGGKATLTLKDAGVGAGADIYTVKVEKRLSGGGYYASSPSPITVDTVKVNVTTSALITPGAITLTGNTSGYEAAKNTAGDYVVYGDTVTSGTAGVTNAEKYALANNDDFANYDSRLVVGTDVAEGDLVSISGTVTTAAGSTIDGALVTIKGAGLAIKAGTANATVYGLGELTFRTGDAGAWSAKIASNKAGKQVVSITSGSVTQKVEITFAAAGNGAGSALAITAPAYILPGRTLTVTGVLTDKYGNPVAVTENTDSNGDLVVSYDGPGLVVGNLPATTDADGKFTVRVLLGSGDIGSAVVTAKYDRNGDEDYADLTGDTPDVIKSATVTLGAAPATAATAAIAGSTKKFYVSVSNNAAAKNVVVKVAGKTVATLKGAAAKKTYTVKATKGSKKVTVYVGGKLIATKTVSVK